MTCRVDTDLSEDFYKLLGVDRGASKADIKKAYFKLAKKYHPDANPGDDAAAKRFAEISNAYEVLSDEEKRMRYDQMGHDSYNNFSSGYGGGGGGFGGAGGFRDAHDVFDELFRSFGGMNQQRQRVATPWERRQAEREPMIMGVRLDFLDSVRGHTVQVPITTETRCNGCNGTGAENGEMQTCSRCHGSGTIDASLGFMQVRTACDKCGGTGTTARHQCGTCNGLGASKTQSNVEVEIPAGVEDGTVVWIDDFHGLRVRVQPSRVFERHGLDVTSRATISLAQAVLGGSLRVQGLDGSVTLDIRPGQQPQDRLRLHGKGMPSVANPRRRGDHYVIVDIEVPRNLSTRQRQLMEEFAIHERDRQGEVNMSSPPPSATEAEPSEDEPAHGEPGKDDEKEGGFFSKLKKTFCHEDDADEKRRHAGKEGTSDGRKADDGARRQIMIQQLEKKKAQLEADEGDAAQAQIKGITERLSELKAQQSEFEQKEAELERYQREHPRWDVDNISKDRSNRTIINAYSKSADEAPKDPEAEVDDMQAFFKNNRSKAIAYAHLKDMKASQKYLAENPELLQDHLASFLVIYCVDCQVDEDDELVRNVARQTVTIQYILELAKSLKRDPRECFNAFFARFATANPEYKDVFEDEISSLIERVKDRAQARLEEAKAKMAEEERAARVGPGGLDPIEVLESLPADIREAFEKQDTPALQAGFAKLSPEDAQYHFKRVVDSGLWVPGGNTESEDADGESTLLGGAPKETFKAVTAAPTSATGVAGKNDQEKADANGWAQDADAASDQADGWLNYVMGSSSYCTLL
ncbi:uncharacterized protein MONBRDRAFT_11958 [Monosiga brevicollis MX1]|uniref:Uncharacterized protein n=1 Tax=Monosiga brevicollis TaxID=81824 RepID=A9VAT3_MONBE|nr:uncharacterized protein MONBRDRAFT_11958 [Monosiga brevicollis MX1]EDQ85430.1 predicted protein [Monosiga brevicollis MX1]|eukprot:XP_001749841.1 hypothetical protein [Monosiga brevicollis MX1]